jgi:hypothetical protein
MKKNLTLSIDEDLLNRARVYAAMEKTSVNEMIRRFLMGKINSAARQDEVTAKLLKLADTSTGRMGKYRPSREETYSGEPRFDR